MTCPARTGSPGLAHPCQCAPRTRKKIGEARVMPANKPPDNAEQDKPKHGQTSALMHIHPVILDTDNSRNHRYCQSPVENAQWQIPDKEPVICVLSLHDPVDPVTMLLCASLVA